MPDVQTPALIERHVWKPGAVFFTIEYLRYEQPAGTSEDWAEERTEAFVFSSWANADALARSLSTASTHVVPVAAHRPKDTAETIPARHRRQAALPENVAHDWREEVPNAGVL